MISQRELREFLYYNPDTGSFIWRKRKGRSAAGNYAGVEGNFNGKPYITIGFNGKCYLAHRLAWLWMTGAIPKEVDHRDGDGLNNSWANLRAATRSQNNANSIRRGSSTGLKGASKNKYGGYRAQICVDGRTRYLGLFKTPQEAQDAYLEEARKHFGEFARS